MHGFAEGDLFGKHRAAGIKLRTQNIGGKGDCAARMFFFAHAVEIGRVADLRLHFFLAIAVIVVGNERDDDAAVDRGR